MVPYAIAVAGDYAESVCASAKIVVRGFPVRTRFTPPMVNAVQTVTITNALRIAETQPHVAEGHSPRARWKVNGISQVEGSAVSCNALDVYQNRSRSSRSPRRIHRRKTAVG